ncbi:unnamed protein product [Allacma fusca]|uniref:Uncharacterized protein n=1 Tax=Allacma fusca TaxID=39272 RepID=A0A8J2PUK8_9HEXA|nr:unnamed protein product [Allacma fusca]
MNMSAILLIGLITVASAIASPHHSDEDDRYTPLIRLLKQLRRRDRYQNYYNDDSQAAISNSPNTATSSAPITSTSDVQTTEFLGQRPQSQSYNTKNYNSGSFSSPDQIRKILGQSQQASSQSTSQSLGDIGNLDNLPSYKPIPSYPVTAVPPQRIEQINRGVSTILNGVGQGSLDQILRGSFMFTRNENVRSVANTVLDSIFGRRTN